MSDNDSFGVSETPWDTSEVDFDAEMIEDDHSVIDGVVDEDFLMSLDDNDSLTGIIMQDNDNVGADGVDIDLDDELNRDPLDDEHHFHTNGFNMTQQYREPNRIPSMHVQSDLGFQRQQPQRYHSLQLPMRHHSLNRPGYSSQQQEQHHQQQNSHQISPVRGRLSHTQSATYVPTRFSERIPDRILENAPSFYSEHPIPQHRSFMAQDPFRIPSLDDPCISPIPNEINLFEKKNRLTRHNSHSVPSSTSRRAPAFRVSPEPSNSSISLPDALELQVQYQRTLKRLGQSMRRSDVTRALVNRQRSGCSQLSNDSERSTGLRFSNDSAVAEEARRRLYQLIQHEN